MPTAPCVAAVLLVLVSSILSPTPANAQARSGTGDCQPIGSPLPAVITRQGVYCFTGNLSTAMARGIAIWIQADNVVLDLNGFVLEGLADRRTTTAEGIFAGGQTNITIRNGTIRGFRYGISLVVVGAIVEDIRADRNTFVGIGVTGSPTVIRNNQVIEPGGSSIVVTSPSTAFGIRVSGHAPRVVNNDVTGTTEGTARVTGISLLGWGGMVVNNRIAFVDRGIEFSDVPGFGSDGKYRDNLTFAVTTRFIGGTDAGNNH